MSSHRHLYYRKSIHDAKVTQNSFSKFQYIANYLTNIVLHLLELGI